MSLKSLCKVLLATVMAVSVWCVPVQPAYGAPGSSQGTNAVDYNGPALAELMELRQFVRPMVKDYCFLMLDILSVTFADRPDMQVQSYEKMLARISSGNDLLDDVNAEIQQKIRMLIHKANTRIKLGETMDPDVHERQMKSLLPSYYARLRQLDAKMYDGVKPRLFKIADKDAQLASQLGIGFAAIDLLVNMLLQDVNSLAKGNNSSDKMKNLKMYTLPDEVKLYVSKIQGQQ